MELQSFNVQNRGTFHLENVALRSGGASADRETAPQTYVPYSQGDQIMFQHQAPAKPVATTAQVGNFLFNLETRIFAAAIASLLTSALFHAIYDRFALLTLMIGVMVFVGFYVMSFFDFQRVLNTIANGPSNPRLSRTPAAAELRFVR